MGASTTGTGRWSEVFWLSNAQASAEKLAPEDRAALERRLALARQRAGAADTLWSNGHASDGLRLAAQAFEDAVSMVAPFARALAGRSAPGASEPEPAGADPADADHADAGPADAGPADAELHEMLAARGFSAVRLRELDALRAALSDVELPDRDADVTAEHQKLYQRLRAMERRLDDALAPALLSPGRIRAQRWARVIGLTALVIGSAVGAYLSLRTPEGIHATASAQWSPDFGGPAGAIDGDPNSEWQTPNHETGWLEVTLEPPVAMNHLRVLNGHNRQYNDRAIRSATIEVYNDGELARSFDPEWAELSPSPEWLEFDLGLDKVDRIRVVVNAFHSEGAALAELQWD